MSSVLKRTTANVPSTRQTSDALFSTSELLVAANVLTQVTTAKHLTTFYMTGLSADIKPRLPSVGSADDGLILRFFHDNNGYELTPYPYDSTTSVWNSGKGYGITLCEQGCYIELRYVHALTKWIVTYKAGGKVMAEGVVLHEPMGAYNISSNAATAGRLADKTRRHMGEIIANTAIVGETSSEFPPGCWLFDGAGDHVYYADSPDWDIFGDQTGHKTVAGWAKPDDAATSNVLISQSNSAYDGNNRYKFYISADKIKLYGKWDGTVHINDLNGGDLSDDDWHHFALVIEGATLGVFVDGVQVFYNASFTAIAAGGFTGSLFIGVENSSDYMDGRMQDWSISYNNPLNATINADGTSGTCDLPAAPMQLVM